MSIKRICLVLCLFLFSNFSYSYSGSYFKITEAGAPANINAIFCLNALGPVGCQEFWFKHTTVISKPALNHNYRTAGIKVLTPGYAILNCTPKPNGYCIFRLLYQSNHFSFFVN